MDTADDKHSDEILSSNMDILTDLYSDESKPVSFDLECQKFLLELQTEITELVVNKLQHSWVRNGIPVSILIDAGGHESMLKIETTVRRLSLSDCSWVSSFTQTNTGRFYDIELDQSLLARSQSNIVDAYHEDYDQNMLHIMEMVEPEQSDTEYFLYNSDSDINSGNSDC